jgi:hypothetical protein
MSDFHVVFWNSSTETYYYEDSELGVLGVNEVGVAKDGPYKGAVVVGVIFLGKLCYSDLGASPVGPLSPDLDESKYR